MEFIIDIFYALLLFSAGFSLIKYRKVVKSWTGNFVWAERYLWTWWTYLALLLVGCFLMVWWVLYPFWWLELMFSTGNTAPSDFKMRE